MKKKNRRRKPFNAHLMRMRFFLLSVVIVAAGTIYPYSRGVRLGTGVLALLAWVFFTTSGLVLTGWLTRNKYLRNLDAPQKTFIFRYYTGFPLAVVAGLLWYTGYADNSGRALLSWLFPQDENQPAFMTALFHLVDQHINDFTGALIFYCVMMLVFGTVIKNIQLSRSAALLNRLKGAQHAELVLAGMGWDQFEKMICDFFRKQGYQAEVTPAGADGGVDIILKGRHGKELVQCKHWKVATVGVSVVREIFGVIQAGDWNRGFIVTSGYFSDEAWEFVKKKTVAHKLLLIDRRILMEMLQEKTSTAEESSIKNRD